MKVYDTDEEAIAKGARRKAIARAIQVLIMILFTLAGGWIFYAFVIAPR